MEMLEYLRSGSAYYYGLVDEKEVKGVFYWSHPCLCDVQLLVVKGHTRLLLVNLRRYSCQIDFVATNRTGMIHYSNISNPRY